jgi:hypothetical protein
LLFRVLSTDGSLEKAGYNNAAEAMRTNPKTRTTKTESPASDNIEGSANTTLVGPSPTHDSNGSPMKAKTEGDDSIFGPEPATEGEDLGYLFQVSPLRRGNWLTTVVEHL